MKRASVIVAFLFCLIGGNAFAVEWPFLKVDCVPELEFFEVRLLRFEKILDGGKNFLVSSAYQESFEYELLKEKYGIIHEYEFTRDVSRSEKDNYMIKECVIGEDKYTIRIDHWGTRITKGEVELAKELFFESAWADWQIEQLIYNAKKQEFLVSGQFTPKLPHLNFLFSTRDGAVLDDEVIKKKGAELEAKVLRKDRDEDAIDEALVYHFDSAFLPLIIDLED